MKLEQFWHDMTAQPDFKTQVQNTIDRWDMFTGEEHINTFIAGVGFWGFDVRIYRLEDDKGLWVFQTYPVINNYALHDVRPYLIFKAKEEAHA